MQGDILKAVKVLKSSRFTTVYTGAGISVESGIPPFRGDNGLWNRYDPKALDLGFFMDEPVESWQVIKEIFYDFFGQAKPNKAHLALAKMEEQGFVSRIITQNIDNLHQEAGSKKVFEFHGNCRNLQCLHCGAVYHSAEISLDIVPPHCRQCGGVLKPGFVFFGESIPLLPLNAAYEAAALSDVFLIIGTTGEVAPANQIPYLARSNGATVIEVNTSESNYTGSITDIFLKGKASEIMEKLENELFAPTLDDN